MKSPDTRRARLLVALLSAAGLGLAHAGPAPAPRRHVVEIRGMEFHPAALEVAPGDTIVWVNRDIVPHTATADGKNGWDTGILTPSHSGSIVVSRVGGSPYGCKLHPTMRGGVKVRRS